MAAAMAQQRGSLGQAAQAIDAGAWGVLRHAFFGRNLLQTPPVASVPDRCTKMLFLGAVDACVCVACRHLLFPTLAHTWVCVVCVCGTVEKSPLDPLTYLDSRRLYYSTCLLLYLLL